MPLVEDLTPEAVSYVMAAELRGMDARGLIPDRRLTAARPRSRGPPRALGRSAGRAEVDGVPVEGTYRKPYYPGRPGRGGAGDRGSRGRRWTASGIAIAGGRGDGQAEGRLTLRIAGRAATGFPRLISTLRGCGCRCRGFGLVQAGRRYRRLRDRGHAWARIRIDRLSRPREAGGGGTD